MKQRKRQFGRWQAVNYLDAEEFDEFYDMCEPINMGRRHVHGQEWDDYILEEQSLWLEELKEKEPPPPKRMKVRPPAGKRRRRILEAQSSSWIAMYIAS